MFFAICLINKSVLQFRYKPVYRNHHIIKLAMSIKEIFVVLMHTEPDYLLTFIRCIAGVIIFPYGMQKLFGFFDDFGGGVGIRESLTSFKNKKIPNAIAWLVIVGQSFGSILLIAGFLGRFAAIANFVIFAGALVKHFPDGWTMNWVGKKKGEGIEYFVLLLSFLLIIAIFGSGSFSIDLALIYSKLKN